MRKPSQKVAERNAPIMAAIREIKVEHPLWGYRRVWAYLRFRQGFQINRKRIYRLMRLHGLLVSQRRALKARRGPVRSKPRASRPNQYWGIDMTKIMLRDFGWIYLVVTLDWHTKKIVGWSVSLQSRARDWLNALDNALQVQFPEGIREENGLNLISDNGSQPTSIAFMRECSLLGIHQIFTTYNNPKGNADTERVLRTLKEDLLWPREWTDPILFTEALKEWIRMYNEEFPHSTLGYMTPVEFENKTKHELFAINF